MILVCDHRGAGLEELLRPLAGTRLDVSVTRSPRETREALVRLRPDLIVIDPLSGRGQVELEELERLRRAGERTPVLLVCDPRAPLASLEAARALRSRSWDLVYRSAPVEEYQLRIERLLRQVEELDELDEMRWRAAHDDRTELLRPLFFQARLIEHVSAAQRHGLPLALILCDLDDFGQINKHFDHTIGDEVIARVGQAIRANLRAEDAAGRMGGDEFAVLLPYTKPLDAARAVNRLRDTIHELSGAVGNDDRVVPVSASIGFETLGAGGGDEPDSHLRLRLNAERALRAAKRLGGNRGVYFRNLR
ncbi:MAG: GGDEF domain-containing protein [Planctomycetes bacterium]|nr:GGDEF domain-containing protein [Planctomycetota bacterium]